MDKFKERGNSFENKFVHDHELEFKINARTHKLVGLWAAETMGMDNKVAFDYATKLVEDNIAEKSNVHTLATRLIRDFQNHGIKKTLDEVQDKIVAIGREAREQVMTK